MLLAVDLASKFSAACLMDEAGNVKDEFDTWALGQDAFLERLVEPFMIRKNYPDVMIVEDLPHRVPFMKITKAVCRLQGRIEEKMRAIDRHYQVLWLPPDVWQKTYGISTAKGAAELVQPMAEDIGYTPPYDYTVYKGKDRATARKVNTDYCSSFLIGRWALSHLDDYKTYDAPRTSRFE